MGEAPLRESAYATVPPPGTRWRQGQNGSPLQASAPPSRVLEDPPFKPPHTVVSSVIINLCPPASSSARANPSG